MKAGEDIPEDLAATHARLEGLGPRFTEQLLREGRAPDPAPAARRPSARRRVVLVLAAAAAVALLAWLPSVRQDGADEPRLPLGLPALKPLRPVGNVRDFAEFAWEGELRPGDSYELRVWNAGERGGPPLLTRRLDARSCRPGPDELARLSRSIEWQVQILDAASIPRATMPAQAALVGP